MQYEQFEVDSVNGVQLQKIFLKTTFGCIETLNLPLLVTSNLLTIVIQACRSTSSPTSRPKLFPGVWLLSGCSQDQSFCSSPFRYLLLWELHRIRLRSRLFLPQIFKIQRAYVYAYAYATMTWESTLRYINTLAKSDLFGELSFPSVQLFLCRNQSLVLASIEAFELAFIFLVFMVMACASYRSHSLYIALPMLHICTIMGLDFTL